MAPTLRVVALEQSELRHYSEGHGNYLLFLSRNARYYAILVEKGGDFPCDWPISVVQQLMTLLRDTLHQRDDRHFEAFHRRGAPRALAGHF